MRYRWTRRRLVKLIIVIVIAAVLLIGAYAGARYLEKRNQNPEPRGDYQQRFEYDTMITHEGVDYRQRNDVTTILLMGIDREGTATTSVGFRNGGQADFLRLLVLDSTNKTVQQIEIDRDTMTPITVLGVLGNRTGLRTAQICLSHGFGDGKEQSAELTVEAVARLLRDAPVTHYIAVNLDGISTLNDFLGGVTVTLEDDFSHLDPAMTKGTTLTLMGDQAELYVRSRMSVGVGTNEARMVRQETYLSRMGEKIQERIQDADFIGQLYDALAPYMTTNMTRGRLINELNQARSYNLLPNVKIAGTHTVGEDGFMQFHADTELLEKTILELFYILMK